MAGKELKFKLVLDADTKNYVQNTKQSEEVTRQFFENLRKYSQSTAQSTSVAEQGIDSIGTEAQQTAQQVAQLDNALDKTNQELQQTDTVAQKASNEIASLKTGFNAVTGALAALGIGATAQEIAQTADAWAGLNARVKIAVGEHGNAQQAMSDVVEIAKETNSNLTATGDLYARLTKIGQEMAIPQDQVLSLTKTINQAIQVSGGSADSAQAAITQLQQALASGVLRGDEFNSMMEQSPRLTQAMADGLGVTTGELRNLANEGKLTTDVVTKSLLSQSEAIQKEFSAFPLTIGSSIENLKTSWTVFIGELDQTHGISAKVAESLTWVADNLDSIATALEVAGRAFLAYKALNIAMTFIEKANNIKLASTAIAQETTAIATNTQAQIANARATTATATAKSGLATASKSASSAVVASNTTTSGSIGMLIGRLGALGIAVSAIGLLIPTVFEPIGTAIGEGVAKLAGYGDAIEKLERQMETERIQAQVSAEMKAKSAQIAEDLRNKTYGLSEASKELATQFAQLTKDGKTTQEALDGIRESMKFDSLTGINDAVSALTMLKETGKITADELEAELKQALSDKDLVVFQANAKAAFAGTANEADKMSALIQASISVALDRTGVSVRQLKGGFSDAYGSASNDVNFLIENLDDLKFRGIDTGLALSNSLFNAIDTAKTQRELDNARAKLYELEKQGVITGAQVALGATKIEEAYSRLPASLNPTIAAFQALGIQTKEQLQAAADSSVRNFDVVKNSGMATADATKVAYTKMLNDVIATGDQSRIAAVKAQAAQHGLVVSIDATGRATVQTHAEMNQAAQSHASTVSNTVTGAYRQMGQVAREEAKHSIEAWNEALTKKLEAEKAQSGGGAAAAMNDNINRNTSAVRQKLQNAGISGSELDRLTQEYKDTYAKRYVQLLNSGGSYGAGKEIARLNDYYDRIAKNAENPSKMVAPASQSASKKVDYTINLGGKSVTLSGTEADQANMNDIMSQLETLKKGM